MPADLVRRLLMRDAPTMVGCFGVQPATFDAQVVIGVDGAITSAIGSGTDASTSTCVLDALKATRFPGGDAETQIKVRLSYVPAGP